MAADDAKRRKVDNKPTENSQTYVYQRLLGHGSFGVVHQAQVVETDEIVAIKTMYPQDKDREVQILKEFDSHPNIVRMHGAFMSSEGDGEKLNLVLEFLSDTLHRVIKHSFKMDKPIDSYMVKLYTFQLFKGLSLMHSRGVVHADIKPQNLLIDGETHTLKICDFGSARRLLAGEPTRPYVCSRFYRAPECILGSACYSTSIDLWSSGCVMAEMMTGTPLFMGKDGIHQLVEIIKVIGTPSSEEMQAMNPAYPEYDFTPKINPVRWQEVFDENRYGDLVEFAASLLKYDPTTRLPPLHCMMHKTFDPLRLEASERHRMLFAFTAAEFVWTTPQFREKLMPRWVFQQRKPAPAPGAKA